MENIKNRLYLKLMEMAIYLLAAWALNIQEPNLADPVDIPGIGSYLPSTD